MIAHKPLNLLIKMILKYVLILAPVQGLPSIVLGILMKQKRPVFKIIFYEKSYHKSNFFERDGTKIKLN